MRRAAIVSPLRTPVGAFGGAFRTVPVEELGAVVARAIVERTGLDPQRLDDVVFAHSYMSGETPCTGRWIALQAGLPVDVPGMQLDRRCGGGLQAIATAAMMVQTGAADVVMAGGVESMSNVEYYTTRMRWGSRAGSVRLHDRLDRGRERSQPEHRFGRISGMIETAENLARDYGIGREACDRFAARSHRRAAAAWEAGHFRDEIVPVAVPQRKGDPVIVERDEGVRGGTTAEDLARLKPILRDGVVTAGNACQQNDAASACLIVAEDKLREFGLEPMGWLVGWAAAGCEPSRMGIGPVPATRKVLARTGLGLDQMDLIELNEAFACQALACVQGWGRSMDELEDRLNVNGSGISLGHPVGATGVRIMTTLLHELRRRKGRYALETMCIGGGQGLAAIVERA
ncbi:acetyl-CoA C-acetyltransferase [Pigmentiphaga sp. GD03639]|uniref:acetyl-CoA C-acetyltransferase n=1 Tax=unclassified Pigmentiphaga TaxID=2626614 RepID=UPI000B41129D|nr:MULTISPECIES: acetyl-CoA C-acetyltransferase [unclassified Pigmentiphaga]MDH2239450.1 acetyl-CoA C-acetyltransferase [Pigmentiphaga sp. GD03639]OVZ60462.1 acetyl-CoA acetyltransferase [Pigmentiphaga sp. NML030171]